VKHDDESKGNIARKTLVFGIIFWLIPALLLFIWHTADLLLVFFAGLMFAIFLRKSALLISEHTKLTVGWGLVVTALIIVTVIGLGGWLAAPSVTEQFYDLQQQLPAAIQQLTAQFNETTWGKQFQEQIPRVEEMLTTGVLRRAGFLFTTIIGIIASFLVILALGFYLAVNPGTYVSGIAQLAPPSKRAKTRHIMHTIGDTLGYWLLGRFAEMIFIGVLTTIALYYLGVPLALVLGLLAGLLNFIPYLGPFIAAVPPLLVALMISPQTALYVLIFFTAIQTAETYLVTPFVDRKTIWLPPALTITVQLLLGSIWGILGVLFASPITAAIIVLVKLLYLEDVYGDEVQVRGEG
jgi:predicted PurR-regulated permease PerM